MFRKGELPSGSIYLVIKTPVQNENVRSSSAIISTFIIEHSVHQSHYSLFELLPNLLAIYALDH